MVQKWYKRSKNGLKMVINGSIMAKHGPKMATNGPKMIQNDQKLVQKLYKNGANSSNIDSKMVQKWS